MNIIKEVGKRFLSTGQKRAQNTEVRYSAKELAIPLAEVSPGAMLVCKTLQQQGYDGYLVGGCVRDWILGLHPKDFDVVTNARPEQIRPLFKRARVIGRRFKLVHVHHQREMIEVATYRAAPGNDDSPHHKQSQSGRVLRDNVYGSIVEDAQRRDFTINALYLDPVAGQVIDYLGGVKDIQTQHLELIGDPDKRFAEDPVRMLRAMRFKAKLGFEIPQILEVLIEKHKHHFKEVSNARLFDETFKLFHHAHAIESWETLREHGFIPMLLPLTANAMQQNARCESFVLHALENTDRRVQQGKPVIPAFFFAVALWHSYQNERRRHKRVPRGKAGVSYIAEKVFRKQYPTIAIPKRVTAIIVEIWDLQWHLAMRRASAIEDLLNHRRFRAAYDFLLLREAIGEVDPALTHWWTQIQNKNEAGRQKMVLALPKPRRGRPRRRTRKAS